MRHRHVTFGLLAFVVAAGLASPSSATDAVASRRLGGADRYDTAVAISRATFPGHRYDAWLARGDLFPDALAASYPASFYNGGAPILLTPPNRLHPAVAAELDRLQVQRVFILGDTTAISSEVETEIRRAGRETVRVAGADRYTTAAYAVAHAGNENSGRGLLATGEDFADALTAGPLAYRLLMPLFITPRSILHDETARALRSAGIRQLVIVGGTAAVSEDVRRAVEAICWAPGDCITTTRLGGRDRAETATLLADYLKARLGTPVHVNLARGDVFADAVAGGPHGGVEGAPTLLATDPTTLPTATRDWLRANSATIESNDAFGTADALSEQVLEEARRAATTP